MGGQLFLQQAPSGPNAMGPPTFYAKVIGAYEKLTAHNLQKETVDMRNVGLAQKFGDVNSEKLGTKQKIFPWRTLINVHINVPGEAKNVTWKFGWSVLPTRDHLKKWSVTPIDKCVHCRETELNEHALIHCTVAKTFWLEVGKAYRQLRVREFLEGRRWPRRPLTVCFYALWI